MRYAILVAKVAFRTGHVHAACQFGHARDVGGAFQGRVLLRTVAGVEKVFLGATSSARQTRLARLPLAHVHFTTAREFLRGDSDM